jgi:methyl-accepting chemotaxis protein
MRKMNITAKIWLSIGIFVVGFVLATVLGQVQGKLAETALRNTSEALFPAAQRSQEAEAAFQRMVKGFSDAVMTQDASGLDRAAQDGKSAVDGLQVTAAIPGLSSTRAEEAKWLASSVQRLVTEAHQVYGSILANPASMAEMQGRMRELASQTDLLKASLQSAKAGSSQDLRTELAKLQQSSANQRWLALLVFGITIIVAGALVHFTIRRSITGPILRVITGVQEAANESAGTSEQLSHSGELVSRNAQEQAACIEETSATLEEIAATSKENANRTGHADELMRNATDTVGRASQAMQGVTASMDVISKSSKMVAAVLKGIDDIAFQTNILALNAAVEAARAGQAGAGFSVVADEVRSLAQRAAEAASRSAEIIEKTIKDVTEGVNFVAVAHQAFDEVTTTISSGSQVVSQIAMSNQEQARGVDQIRQAMSRIEAVTQSNTINAQQTAEAAGSMSSQVQTTRENLQELCQLVGARQG